MINDTYFLTVGVLFVVIALYSMAHSQHHWLPDLLGLVLALSAERRLYAVGAVLLFAAIRHTPVAYTVADYVPQWLHALIIPRARDMSISVVDASQLEEAYQNRISEAEMTNGNAGILQPVAEKSQYGISADAIELLATGVLSGMMTIGEATRLGSGAQSGRKYQVVGRRIKAAMARQQEHYVPLTPEKQQELKTRS